MARNPPHALKDQSYLIRYEAHPADDLRLSGADRVEKIKRRLDRGHISKVIVSGVEQVEPQC